MTPNLDKIARLESEIAALKDPTSIRRLQFKGNDTQRAHFIGVLESGVVEFAEREIAELKKDAENAEGNRAVSIAEAIKELLGKYKGHTIESPGEN